MDFDRVSRYELVARLVTTLAPRGELVLDVGGAGGLLRDRLPEHRLVTADLAGADLDVMCSGTRLPFADGTFAVTTALDVLEHLDEALRPDLIDELLRVSRRGCVIAGPFAGPAVERAEGRLRSFYRTMVGHDHRWLSEHDEHGLPEISAVLGQIRSRGWGCDTASSNPLVFWERLQLANFIGSRSHDSYPLEAVHAELLERFLDGADAEAPAYRHILVGTREPDLVGPTLAELRTPGGTGWSTPEAIAAIDGAIAAMINTTWQERGRLERQVSQQATRIEEGDRSVAGLRVQLERLEAALRYDAEQALALVRARQERRLRELEGTIRDVTAQRDAFEVQLRSARATEQHLSALLDRLTREVEMLLTSRRWRIGDRIGDVMAKVQRGPVPPPATLHLERTIAEFRGLGRGPIAPATSSAPAAERDAGVDRGGVDHASDAARRRAKYQRFISNIERAPRPTESAPEIRAIILLDESFHTDVQQQIGLRRTVEGCRAAALPVTVVGTSDYQDAAVTVVSDPIPETVRTHLVGTSEDAFIFLLPGDLPSAHLRDGVSEALATSERRPAAILVDTDVIDDLGERTDPRMAGQLSPDLVVEIDVLGRGIVFLAPSAAASAVQRTDRDAPRDALLRLADGGAEILKVDRVLVHHAPDGRSPEQRLDMDAVFAQSVLARRMTTSSSVVREPWGVRVEHRDPDKPLVSIVVPFKDRVELTRACVTSILRITTYERYEILLIDNRSEDAATAEFLTECRSDPRIRVLTYDQPFNYSKLNNWAAERAAGDVLVFLNNDTKVLSPAWLEDAAGWTAQDGVGLVGAKLLLPNGRIQHAGVVVGVMGFAAHAFAGEHEAFVPHPDLRHPRSWSSVTGACAAIRKQLFIDVGGFDETFLVTGNDVELGLRLMRRGYRNLFVPTIVAFHLEKGSRASMPAKDVDKRRSLETYVPELEVGDPYWNRQLSRWSTQMEPRVDEHEDGYPELVAQVTSTPRRPEAPRKIGRSLDVGEPGFLRRYDASAAELETNAGHVRRFRAERTVDPRRVTWFVPAFDHVYRGGIYTIMRIADRLTSEFGTVNQIVVIGKHRADLTEMRRQIKQAFPSMKVKMIHLGHQDREWDLPAADLGICTLWTSAYHLLRYNQCKGKVYLVQDYEPSFYAGNAIQGLVTQTYRFGFDGLGNTLGVGQAYADFGNPTLAFTPAVDLDRFYPAADGPERRAVRVMFYGRPSNERNAFELGVQAFLRLKERWGDRVEIVSAGAEFDVADYGLDGVVENLGVLPDIDAVAAEYRRSDIGAVFMFSRHPSYQPFEYMASGCATVTNENEANSWLYVDGENALLTPPTVTAVADSISRLIDDEALRDRIVRGGLETVRSLSWDRELQRVTEFLRSGSGDLLGPSYGRRS